MRKRLGWIALVTVVVVFVVALTTGNAGRIPADQALFRDMAHGICLSHVMKKVMDRSSSEPPEWFILSREADDALFRAHWEHQQKIDKAESPAEKGKRERDRLAELLGIMRRQSPEFVSKCDKLAVGMMKCMRHGEDKDRLQGCIARENEGATREVFLYMNRYLERYMPNVFETIRKGE
jgi:hypothetical protein